jgi:hypothetical protein
MSAGAERGGSAGDRIASGIPHKSESQIAWEMDEVIESAEQRAYVQGVEDALSTIEDAVKDFRAKVKRANS